MLFHHISKFLIKVKNIITWKQFEFYGEDMSHYKFNNAFVRRRNLRNYSIFDASAIIRIGEASKRDIFIVIFMLEKKLRDFSELFPYSL